MAKGEGRNQSESLSQKITAPTAPSRIQERMGREREERIEKRVAVWTVIAAFVVSAGVIAQAWQASLSARAREQPSQTALSPSAKGP